MGRSLGPPVSRRATQRERPPAPPPPQAAAADTHNYALQRCGSKAASFCHVGAGNAAIDLGTRIRDSKKPVRFSIVDTWDQNAWPAFAARLDQAGALRTVDDAKHLSSVEGAQSFPNESLDFIFLAADAPEAVARDLAAWWPKLRQGGLMAGPTPSNAGVTSAIDAFVDSNGLRPGLQRGQGWWLHKPIPTDAIYCINLPARTDRRRAVEQQFRSVDLADAVEFFAAVDGKTLSHPHAVSDGQAGCTASHMAVLRKAEARGLRHVLVFEDDVTFAPTFAETYPAALSRCPASYDLFYLGASCMADWGCYLSPFTDLVSRAGRVVGTTAYIVNVAAIAQELHRDLDGLQRVIDCYFADHIQPKSNCYVCTPYLVSQVAGYSDVARGYTDPQQYLQYVWR
jgi:hypothetical protein